MKANEMFKTVGLMALAVILVGGGLVYWQWGSRSEAAARVATLESELPDLDQVNADLAKSQEELEVSRFELEHLEKSLPQKAYIPTLVTELEALGAAKNVKLTGVRPILQPNTDAAETADDAYQVVDIDITGQGTYRAMLEMISALKSFPKILAVMTISMQPRQDAKTTGSNELDATIRLRAFVFKEALAPLEGSSEALKEEGALDGTSAPNSETAPGHEPGQSGTQPGTQPVKGDGGSESHQRVKSKDLDARLPRKDAAL